MTKIRLGIVGANPDRGWAKRGHIPALALTNAFELTGVCTTRQETADRAAVAFGARRAYDSYMKLADDPDIDAVAVVVRVDRHYEPVMAALRARKPVLCEWPLGHSTTQAEQMVGLASQHGVITQVGFQTRANPVVRRMRDLFEQGYIGTLRSITITSTLTRWGAAIPRESIYGADVRVGVNVVTIQSGHTLDMVRYCFGEFAELHATIASLRSETRIAESDEVVAFTAPDQCAISGRLLCGAVVSAHFQSGALFNDGFRMVVRGTDGEIVLQSDDVIPTGALTLLAQRSSPGEQMRISRFPDVNTHETVDLSIQVIESIASSYDLFAAAINGRSQSPHSFETGLQIHRLLDQLNGGSKS